MNTDNPDQATSPLNFGGSSPFTSGQTEPLTDVTPEVAEAAPEAVAPVETPQTTLEADVAQALQEQGAPPVEAAPVVAEEIPQTEPTAPVETVDTAPAEAIQPEQVGEASATPVDQVPEELPTIAASTDGEIEKAIAERDALNAKIEEGQKAQRVEVINQIKNVVNTYKIPLPELAEALGIKATRKGSKAKPKYRNPADGKEWSGRGKEPLWIRGKNREQFLITA